MRIFRSLPLCCGRLTSVGLVAAVAALALVLLIAPSGARAAIATCTGAGETFAGGSGTSADPYLVATPVQLNAVRNTAYRACAFRQTADIALTGEWTPIGSADVGTEFSGSYDGGGHLISGLRITSGSIYIGLFGYALGATLENVRLAGTVNVPGGSNVGALVGIADRPTRIVNVHSSVSVSGSSFVGGLVGFLPESTISRSSSTGSVTATAEAVGSLVGRVRSAYALLPAEISDSFATGPVTGMEGREGVGGLVGSVEASEELDTPYAVRVIDSYAAASVTGGTGTRRRCFPSDDPLDPPRCDTVHGTTGGLIAPIAEGVSAARFTVTGSFWDMQVSGRSTTLDDKGTGATTSQLQTFATFRDAGWDISDGWSTTAIWGICEGSYPFLNAEYDSSPCPRQTPSSTSASGASPGPPSTTVVVSTPIDGDAQVRIGWSSAGTTAPAVLTTRLPAGVAFPQARSGCATVRGRVVSIAVPALRGRGRGACSFRIGVTRRAFSLTVRGGVRPVTSATVYATASPAVWVRSALAILHRGAARPTLNGVLFTLAADGTTRRQAAEALRHDVLAVRERQLAAARQMDRAPASLRHAERLLHRALTISVQADHAFIVWLNGDTTALARGIAHSERASSAKARLISALQGHAVAVPPATSLWP